VRAGQANDDEKFAALSPKFGWTCSLQGGPVAIETQQSPQGSREKPYARHLDENGAAIIPSRPPALILRWSQSLVRVEVGLRRSEPPVWARRLS
jgi:hypothetical protein